MTKLKRTIVFVLLFALSTNIYTQVHVQKWASIIKEKESAWFASNEAIQVAENVLLYQRNIGGWPKNIQMQNSLTDTEKQNLIALKLNPNGATTDNGATCQEMLFLSKIYTQIPDERYKNAFLAGLDYLLKAQYENGGWPQFYPAPEGYYSHITYNDDSMVNIMNVLKEITDGTNYYSIKPLQETISKAKKAFNKGIECVLKTQYIQNGKLTSWCAQHDEFSLLPVKARSYELPSLSGYESAPIALLLMTLKKPSPEVINAVNNAVAWFEEVRIKGIREDIFYDEKGKIIDRKMVLDPNASGLWARFMELENNKPFFCDRDGIKKTSLAEIDTERRNGYSWYTQKPKEVLEKFPVWQKKWANTKINKAPKDIFTITIAQDGSGDYTSIQEAINNSPAFPYRRVIINIKDGIYYEKVRIPECNPNISLIGESKEKTIITYDDYFSKINLGRNSTFYTYTLSVEGDNFIAQNLTIKNSAGQVGQAVALALNANKVFILNCNLLGNQDTFYATGNDNKQYLKDCYIEGTTDFIFGSATVLFENCTIHNKTNSYTTAASTPQNTAFGFVFENCKLTGGENVTEAYLGRPWRIYSKTVFINCEIGNHIKPEGWDNWSKPEAEKSAFYAEYNCRGEGFQPERRVAWSHQLKKSEAKKYTIENILGTDFSKAIKESSLK